MMLRRAIPLAFAAAALSCAPDGIVATDTVNGLKYSARFNLGTFVNVIARLQNVSSANQERTYIASCPVRIRLYRPADGFKVYDQTRLPCQDSTHATLSVPPGEFRELQSGLRTVEYLLGDSLALQTYVVRAVLRTEPNAEMEVVAGEWRFGGNQFE